MYDSLLACTYMAKKKKNYGGHRESSVALIDTTVDFMTTAVSPKPAIQTIRLLVTIIKGTLLSRLKGESSLDIEATFTVQSH